MALDRKNGQENQMFTKTAFALVFSALALAMAGCASSANSHQVVSASPARLKGSDVTIARLNHRVIHLFSVDGKQLKKVIVPEVMVDPGVREVGIFVIDRTGRLTGLVKLNLESGKTYRIEADRAATLGEKPFGSLLLHFPRFGLRVQEEGASGEADFTIKLIEEGPTEIVIKRIPMMLSEDYPRLRDGS